MTVDEYSGDGVGDEGGGSGVVAVCEMRHLSLRERLDLFREAQKRAEMTRGEWFFLLDNGWYKDWESMALNGMVGMGDEREGEVDEEKAVVVGPIDNSPLYNKAGEFRTVLLEGRDYIFVGKEAWDLLHGWYGGGPEVKRQVIFNGFEEVVEVYRLDVKVFFQNVMIKVDDISKETTVGELKERVTGDRSENGKYSLYLEGEEDAGAIDDKLTIYQALITESTVLMLKKSSNALKHPLENGNGTKEPTLDEHKRNLRAGLTGLKNLGNTCFMNSALQCLSNTEKLSEFFLSGRYEEEINEENPIGRQGNLAREYATVLRNLWKAEEKSYAPRGLKFQVGQYAPQFHGYAQQDSQELMAFLMDGLHEDLNRIRKKPICEAIEGGDRPDDIVADLSWKNHRKRNDSIIVDLFHGQYKSTVVCPTCSKVSVTFDPFMYLTLPLPATAERNIDIIYVPLVQENVSIPTLRPIKYCMKSLHHVTKVRHVKEYIAEKTGADPAHLIITIKLSSNRLDFRLPYDDAEELSESQTLMTLMAYEVKNDVSGIASIRGPIREPLDKEMEEDPVVLVEVLQIFRDEEVRFIATPQIMSLRRSDCTGVRIHTEVRRRVEKLFDFTRFAALEAEKRENEEPYRLLIQKKGLHSTQTIPREEVLPDSDEVLHTVMMENRVSVIVEWLPETDISDFWYYEAASGKLIVEDESVKRLRTQKLAVTLDECMQFWEKEETLTEQNAWYCPNCKEHKHAKKSLKLWKAPETLVIHLKRFSYSTWSRHKVDLFVDFPLTGLDLRPYIATKEKGQSYIYDLYAVSNHIGGLGGGHYNAYAISPWKGNRWYSFDDSLVSEVGTASTVRSSSAYLLFYRRRAQTGTA